MTDVGGHHEHDSRSLGSDQVDTDQCSGVIENGLDSVDYVAHLRLSKGVSKVDNLGLEYTRSRREMSAHEYHAQSSQITLSKWMSISMKETLCIR